VLFAWLRGGSDTSAPLGGTVPATGPPANVPLIAICPQAAVTCCCPAKVDRVPASNDVALESADGYATTWCSWLFASAGELKAL